MATTEGQEVRDFSAFMLDRPATHREMSEKMHQLIAAVQDTGKKGTIQLTISLELFDGDPDRLVVNDRIVMKVPEHDRKGSIFFPDRAGNLSRSDPNQLSFDSIKDVDVKHTEVREVK